MLDNIPILAIETSQSSCGACVYFDDSKFFEMNVNYKNSHAEKIYEIIDAVIKSAGISLKEIGAVAVSSGPGSFTGLRIGMAAAKGVAFGAALPIIAVPTFEALAFQLAFTLKDESNFIIANKVNSEEVYFAQFKIKGNNYIFTQDLQIVKVSDKMNFEDDCLVFGNASFNIKLANEVKLITTPKPEYVAMWAKYFGKDKLRYDFDFLEPNYIKNFVVKEKVL